MNSVSDWIEVACCLDKINSVHVRYEAERQGSIAVMLQRFVSHHRTEVRTADADVNDVSDSFAGVAFPRTAANTVGEIRHFIEHAMDLGHDVFAVHQNGRVLRRTQSHVQNGAVFRDIDFVTTKHGLQPFAQAALMRQTQQQLEGLIGNAVLGIVQKQAGGFRGEAGAAFGVVGEQFPQVKFFNLSGVRGE